MSVAALLQRLQKLDPATRETAIVHCENTQGPYLSEAYPEHAARASFVLVISGVSRGDGAAGPAATAPTPEPVNTEPLGWTLDEMFSQRAPPHAEGPPATTPTLEPVKTALVDETASQTAPHWSERDDARSWARPTDASRQQHYADLPDDYHPYGPSARGGETQ